uniref:Uncharacterized protein n=1 Tax=Chromera velia CCMP2878 TaxID=1169474 RepID=A0A0G4F5N8_9ALVE|eukprot:Cvel_15241.t1-p1 / transcript=Cvel_15241.t1 / gene=Cvel_15241 / organism=Chromera_velia_CCMP2878 / gene_product=hypothetical protein / transcript_product=hypothetical protein / location=Cvel_scaffold1116:11824-12187(+) / protein_length=78 / sequence_SO=supercontig / SO=protein_coding / is_pseudo=false
MRALSPGSGWSKGRGRECSSSSSSSSFSSGEEEKEEDDEESDSNEKGGREGVVGGRQMKNVHDLEDGKDENEEEGFCN